jgi:hypothetical protein
MAAEGKEGEGEEEAERDVGELDVFADWVLAIPQQ